MRILFEITHPKHFHQFKNLIKILEKEHTIKVIARDKDVVVDLLKKSGLQYELYGAHGKTMTSKFLLLPNLLSSYKLILKSFKPNLIVSRSSPYAAILCTFSKCKTMILPDSEVVTFNNKFTVPLSDYIVTPLNYSLDHGKKHQRVNGIFENSYLHPTYFKPDTGALNRAGLSLNEPFAILRFVGWFANHDKGRSGFSNDQKIHLVETLSSKMKVFISGEGPLPDEVEKYRAKFDPSDMHNLMSFAKIYIGDSQTMAAEAALLGTNAIRFNSFVGSKDMSNFKMLEELGLLNNLSSYESVLSKTIEIISKDNDDTIKEAQRTYLERVGDINQETAAIINNFL